jgi:hypothetical protein
VEIICALMQRVVDRDRPFKPEYGEPQISPLRYGLSKNISRTGPRNRRSLGCAPRDDKGQGNGSIESRCWTEVSHHFPWHHNLPLCHPERSRGICSSADPSWKCFSTDRSVVERSVVLRTQEENRSRLFAKVAPEAARGVIVHYPGRLHPGVDDDWANKFEAALFELRRDLF